jgi:hypothetical protein
VNGVEESDGDDSHWVWLSNISKNIIDDFVRIWKYCDRMIFGDIRGRLAQSFSACNRESDCSEKSSPHTWCWQSSINSAQILDCRVFTFTGSSLEFDCTPLGAHFHWIGGNEFLPLIAFRAGG